MFGSQCNLTALRQPPLRRVVLIFVAALSAVHVDAARVDGRSIGEAQGKPSRHKAAKAPKKIGGDQVKPETKQERELREAHDYVQAVQVTDKVPLGAVRDTVDRLERLRQVVSGSGSFRDPEKRKMVRVVLRDIRVKIDELKPLVAMKEAAGEVDDGGDTPPSKRPNICTAEDIDDDDDLVTEINALCDALDAVRQAFAAREHEEGAMFDIVERITRIERKPWYANPSISSGINAVLHEEKRWVTKKIAARAARGEPFESIASILDLWMGDDFDANPNNDDLAAREDVLRKAYEVAVGTVVNESTTLADLRTGHYRLHLWSGRLESLLPVSGPPFSDRVHALLKMYSVKMRMMRVRAKQREAEGDHDDGGEVPPTRRLNICSGIDEHEVSAEVKMAIKEICAKLDNIREVVLSGGDAVAELNDVMGRVNALRDLSGYADMPVAGGVELVFAEEWRWLKKHLGEESSRPKELPPRITAALPTAPPASVAAAMVDSALKALELKEARNAVQAMTVESSSNFSAFAGNIDRLDLIKENVAAVGAPQIELVDAQPKALKEKGEELELLTEGLQADGPEDDSLGGNLIPELELGSQGDEEGNFISKLELGSPSATGDNLREHKIDVEPVSESFEAEKGNLISDLELDSPDEEEGNLASQPELGSQSAADDDVTSKNVMAVPCIRHDSYVIRPEGQSQFEEIRGESRRSPPTVSDDDVAMDSWSVAIGDFARRVVALITAGPRIIYDVLLMFARGKAASLRQLAQRRPASEAIAVFATPAASADGAGVVDGTDVALQTPRAPGASADASAGGADDVVN